MKILIGSTEICGWVSLFKETLIKAGHECYSVIDEKNRFNYKDNYNIIINNYIIKHSSKNRILRKAIAETNKLIPEIILKTVVNYAKNKFDIVIFFWRSFYPDSSDIKILHDAGVKIIFYFVGSDVRDLNTFIQDFGITEWEFPSYVINEYHRANRIKYIQEAEKYASAIFSVPDQAGLQKRPFYHLQIPIDVSKFSYIERSNIIPNVVHIPSDPWKKGTDIIEKTLYELQKEGVKFTYKVIQNISNDEVLKELMNADILVDEIVFHGPGVLSMEAMASGCVVATKYFEKSPQCFRPPIWNINPQNIKNQLRVLFSDHNLRLMLSKKSREYVIQNNSADKVIKDVIDKALYQPKEDYFLPINPH